ncbi:hypothetical protein COS91_03515 [Candidatus Desantisbacteria bacterium CG07_land_8_20_14_0_80_39_15]|uniref:DUF3108 domain-containing protein n=1 Tax=Candidatus Desantisbacteria bacterium CG07_land_8_20_14_0_80_39_15 TaxID=1974549 RepID=A0A2M6ZGX8_9BACT|nr:MAG: hypothetical protein COS91_03515 [Candidatus Desantisbacteria bacterium CG07_land_8_20_14_0_80_39_15]
MLNRKKWGLSLFLLLFASELFKNPAIDKPEKWKYRSSEGGKWNIMTDSSKYITRNGKGFLIITSVPEDKKYVTTMTLEPDTLKPISIKIDGETETVFEAKYRGNMAVINLFRGPKNIRNKKILLAPVTYDQRTLFWLLRGYPFDKPKELEIDLIMPLGNRCSMKVRYLGTEIISVPAGKFIAHKLEVEPNAILPMFSEKLRTYFWYSREKIPKFLKYSYPTKNESAELMK